MSKRYYSERTINNYTNTELNQSLDKETKIKMYKIYSIHHNKEGCKEVLYRIRKVDIDMIYYELELEEFSKKHLEILYLNL